MSGLLVRTGRHLVLAEEFLAFLARHGDQKAETVVSEGVQFFVSPLLLGGWCSGRALTPCAGTVVVLSGWLHNREELVKALDAAPGCLDDELAWAAYLHWGDQAWSKLAGEYILALWEDENQTLRLITDHFGTRSLYWKLTDGELTAGSDITTVAHSGERPRWDDTAIAHFLSFGRQLSQERTEFLGVNRLPPAHLLRFCRGESQRVRYWVPPEPGYVVRSSQTQVEEFREVMKSAVRARLRIGAVGFELSGGIDSTGLLAAAVELSPPSSLCAFTTGFSQLPTDQEPALAATTAAELGVTHRIIRFESEVEKVLSRELSPGSLVLNSPDSPWHYKFRAAREFSPVLLCGDGGDPALGWSGWCDRSSGMRRQLANALQALHSHLRVWGPDIRNLGLRRRFLSMGRPALEHELPPWLDKDYLRRCELGRAAQREVDRFGEEAQRFGMTCSPFWNDLFRRRSPDATGTALLVSYPYFDQQVWKFLNSVPPLPWFRQKALARLALRGRVREEIVTRPKTVASPFADSSASLMREHLSWFQGLWNAHRDILTFYLDREQLFHYLGNLQQLPFAQQYQLLAAVRFMRWIESQSHSSLN